MHYTHHSTCRICGSADLMQVLDLGKTPPANAYVQFGDLDKQQPTYPLAIYFCRGCSLVQQLDVVDPDMLFKNYHYMTGANFPATEHFRRYAEDAIKRFISSADDLVIDIGGNDGVLLDFVKDFARVLNVDPADNLAAVSEAKGVPFYTAFFNSKTSDELLRKYGHANVVTANNVFAHTDPLRDVFAGVSKLIRHDGVFIFEVHWVKHLLETGCFDQIYHEHLCFHSLHALKHLVESSGMKIFDVEIVPMQGQSLRVYAAKDREPKASVAAILKEEQDAGLTREETYRSFSEVVERNKAELLTLLSGLKASGKKIVGYGAPAKGNTLLNYYGIGTETLDYLTDSTPLKHGLYSPGMKIPIKDEALLETDTPDYLLLLAWNYKDAILQKEQSLRDRGALFILTIPSVQIV